VYRWRDMLKVGGIDALRDMSKGGRPAQLGAAELSRLYVALLEGPQAHGFATPPWTGAGGIEDPSNACAC
jgi:hypothetical protein